MVDGVKSLLPSIQASAPDGIDLKLDFDQSIFVRAALTNVLREAVISSILVSLMILFFLGSFRSVAIVSSSIPLAILVGIAGLFLTGNTLNLMTLGGLALAIGMLVDDATVAVENIHRNRTSGKRLTVAILDGAHQVATPALAATLTICIVFFPVVLLTGPARYLFTPLALAVVFSMLASYLLSRTLVPALARLLESEDAHAETEGNGLVRALQPLARRRFERFQDGYGRCWSVALQHRPWMLATFALVVLVSAALPIFAVGLDFFPDVDVGPDAPALPRADGDPHRGHRAAGARGRAEDPGDHPAERAGGAQRQHRDPALLQPGLRLHRQHRPPGRGDPHLAQARAPAHPRVHGAASARSSPKSFPGSSLLLPARGHRDPGAELRPPRADRRGHRVQRPGEGLHRRAGSSPPRLRRIPGVVDVRIPQVLDYPTLNLDVDRLRAAQVGLSQRDVANNLLTSLSSSSLVSPNFWLSPQNNVNYIVAVQTPLPAMRSTNDLLATPLTAGGPGSPADSAPGRSPMPPHRPAASTSAPSPSSRQARPSPR